MKKNVFFKLKGVVITTLISMFLFASPACANSDLGDGLFAKIETNRGDIIIQLEFEKVPLTVCNFVALAEGKMIAARGRPYYDGMIFHRVISRANGDDQDFMIQGGDPQGTGSGGPGYRFPDEFHPTLRHDGPGVLAMANAGPNTNGSQFYITIVATPHLDNRHTVFGRVVQGQNVVNSIRQRDRIQTVTIIRNGAAANAFKADQDEFDILVNRATRSEALKIEEQRNEDLAEIQRKYPDARMSPSGIHYIVERTGSGAKPVPGRTVSVNYTASLLSGRFFDNSDLHGGPQDFELGTHSILPGMDEALMDMTSGEKRTVIIPPELAFGEHGSGNDIIPPYSFLVFEMEIIDIK